MSEDVSDVATSLAAACVLVVADNEANLLLLRSLLERLGISRVHVASDPHEAVARFEQYDPDLVIVDLQMPSLDGYAVLAELRGLVDRDDFRPVLVLTADTKRQAMHRALAAGANDFLLKPVDGAEALLRIRNLLETRQLHVALQERNTDLIRRLNEERAKGREEVEEFDRRRMLVERALATGSLTMVYQPIVDLREAAVVGVEALARFSCEPSQAPDRWFALANDVALGLDMELLAVEAVLRDLDRVKGVFVSINASPALVTSGALDEAFALSSADQLVLELTEHTAIGDYPSLEAALLPLRERGVRLAVDDTGAGFASLKHILGLAPDIIKLDLALTRGIDVDPVRRALAAALIGFANEIGATLVAEGIESAAELQVLRTLGVRWGQGFFLARPAPLNALDLGGIR
ncbi:MAG: hypothetical protein QOH64_3566 [Acidimicrobiaceae bacterium]